MRLEKSTQRSPKPIAFVSTMDGDPWGGSEELWWGVAMQLLAEGQPVCACVQKWLPSHPKIQKLQEAGADVLQRPKIYPLWKRGARALLRSESSVMIREMTDWLRKCSPALVVLNEKIAVPHFRAHGNVHQEWVAVRIRVAFKRRILVGRGHRARALPRRGDQSVEMLFRIEWQSRARAKTSRHSPLEGVDRQKSVQCRLSRTAAMARRVCVGSLANGLRRSSRPAIQRPGLAIRGTCEARMARSRMAAELVWRRSHSARTGASGG